jgi:hypothetical protein
MSGMKVNESKAKSAVNDTVGGSEQDEQRKKAKAFEEALMLAMVSEAANMRQLDFNAN